VAEAETPSSQRAKPAEWRRWAGILLRAAHLVGVTLMGAELLGATTARGGAALTLASGIALFVSELADGRVRVRELAGAWVPAKLALVALAVAVPGLAAPVFWTVLVVSAVLSHAPRGLRHWPRR
jgi:hypothetical protein